MSTGKRLAKRSIIGTRVCAPGPDGLWYSGVIQDVKTPPSANSLPENNNCINLTPDTKYVVRFDFKTQSYEPEQQRHLNNMILTNISPAQSVRRNALTKEFQEHELIGPGFRSIIGVQLHPGQRVFLTHNGRESSGDVLTHDAENDEVVVKITPMGSEEPVELRKRLEEVRLLESRRSARLADQDRDTDFARLADMAGDRRRASHSIDVPQTLPLQNSRKRRPSCSQDERDSYQFGGAMDECNAALVLMSLSCSPHSPHTAAWNRNLGSSPGSSNASWSSSGSSSPPLSDDFGIQPIISDSNSARIRTASTSDEGIVMDYSDEAPRKRKAHGPRFRCTWKGCNHDEYTVAKIELHVRNAHLGPKKPRRSFDDDGGTFSDSDHEEEFYYTEIEDEENGPTPPSPPTLSHRDMARPPHEDPEFQKKIVVNFRQGLLALSQNGNGNTKHSPNINAGPINIPNSPIGHQKYSWSQQSPASPMKHQRHSPRPSTSSAPYPSPTYMHQHHYNGPSSQHQPMQHSHLQQQHPQSVPTITSSSVHHSPTSAPSSMASLSHSAPAASPLSLATMHLAAHHQPNHHSAQPQPHHHQQIHQAPQPHHHQQVQQQQVASSSGQHHQQSPKGRTRGENKKCRKVYGMDHKDQWCTQCKWKKACSRFGD